MTNEEKPILMTVSEFIACADSCSCGQLATRSHLYENTRACDSCYPGDPDFTEFVNAWIIRAMQVRVNKLLNKPDTGSFAIIGDKDFLRVNGRMMTWGSRAEAEAVLHVLRLESESHRVVGL